jgi:hypothetical protein
VCEAVEEAFDAFRLQNLEAAKTDVKGEDESPISSR